MKKSRINPRRHARRFSVSCCIGKRRGVKKYISKKGGKANADSARLMIVPKYNSFSLYFPQKPSKEYVLGVHMHKNRIVFVAFAPDISQETKSVFRSSEKRIGCGVRNGKYRYIFRSIKLPFSQTHRGYAREFSRKRA